MEWKDLQKMTVLKLREEALKYPQIEAVHGKDKPQLMAELAAVLHIDKPHVTFSEQVNVSKSELKHKIHDLKLERDKLIAVHDDRKLHDVRREIHHLKHAIRRMEAHAAHG